VERANEATSRSCRQPHGEPVVRRQILVKARSRGGYQRSGHRDRPRSTRGVTPPFSSSPAPRTPVYSARIDAMSTGVELAFTLLDRGSASRVPMLGIGYFGDIGF